MKSTQAPRPDFLVIGAQRCATSWLYFCLKEHPEVYVPFIKELSYFSHYYDKGWDWYLRYFELADGKKAIGEVTPAYIYRENAPERIAKDLPEVKLVAIFRNPIDRAFSQYQKHVRAGIMKADFEMALTMDKEYIERGLYCMQLKRYLKYFQREKILVMIYEDIAVNPQAYLRKVYEFIGADPGFTAKSSTQVIPADDLNTGLYNSVFKVSQFARKNLRLGPIIDTVKRTSVRRAVDKILNEYGPAPTGKKTPASKELKIQMKPETRQGLARLFEEENKKLAELLGRDLSHWK